MIGKMIRRKRRRNALLFSLATFLMNIALQISSLWYRLRAETLSKTLKLAKTLWSFTSNPLINVGISMKNWITKWKWEEINCICNHEWNSPGHNSQATTYCSLNIAQLVFISSCWHRNMADVIYNIMHIMRCQGNICTRYISSENSLSP